MDNKLDLTGLRTGAQTANTDLTKQITDAPGLLGDLKKSLVSIYAKDNPLIQARDTALSNYMSSGDKARAEFLPSNQPNVAGSPLNYSPTELQALVSGRQSAALAPLLGLNQAVTQGYGNIGDILNAAGSGLQSQIHAAETRASSAFNLYKEAINEYNAMTSRQNANLGNSFMNGLTNLGLGGGSDSTQTNGGWEIIPSETAPTITSQSNQSQPLVANQPSLWDSLLGLFGATPRQGQAETTPLGQSLSNYNFNNVPIKLGV